MSLTHECMCPHAWPNLWSEHTIILCTSTKKIVPVKLGHSKERWQGALESEREIETKYSPCKRKEQLPFLAGDALFSSWVIFHSALNRRWKKKKNPGAQRQPLAQGAGWINKCVCAFKIAGRRPVFGNKCFHESSSREFSRGPWVLGGDGNTLSTFFSDGDGDSNSLEGGYLNCPINPSTEHSLECDFLKQRHT